MIRGRLAASAVAALVLMATAGAQSTFTLKVHTGRGQVGYDVNSTMIIGERDMLVIDPQFSLSEAQSAPVLTLEGEEFPITGGVQGADGPGNSFVWVP